MLLFLWFLMLRIFIKKSFLGSARFIESTATVSSDNYLEIAVGLMVMMS
jgi:hypothetical protein